jgi:uncharacterized protein YukE
VGDKFSVNPESLLGASARFELESEQLASALSRLQASLGQLGDVCGNDDQGHRFAAGYVPNEVKIEQALRNVSRGLADIGRGLEVMGLNYQGSDAASQVRKGS